MIAKGCRTKRRWTHGALALPLVFVLQTAGKPAAFGADEGEVGAAAPTDASASDHRQDDPAANFQRAERKNTRLDSILQRVVAKFEDANRPPPSMHGVPTAAAAQRHQRRIAEAAAKAAPLSEGASVAVTFVTADASASEDLREWLSKRGGDPRNVGEDYVEAYVPVPLLKAASNQPGVLRVQTIIPPEPLRGDVTSQGVAAHGAGEWHASGFTGVGVKVGVIDSGFQTLQDLLGRELPASVTARCYSGIGRFGTDLADCERETIHGTAVAEAVLDMAPDVNLYIANPVSRADLRAAADWMASEGVQVINYSVGWPYDGPGDGTSPFSASPLNTVDAAVENGILWVSAAGNSGQQAWYGAFKDTNNDGWHEWNDSTDRCNPIAITSSFTAQLRWADDWTSTTSDLDLHLLQEDGASTGIGSDYPQTGDPGQIPIEIFNVAPDSVIRGQHCLAVKRDSGATPDWLQLVVIGAPAPVHATGNGGITNPAESANAGLLSVGAAPHNNTHRLESYSSRGPAPDGRRKPELVAVDLGDSAVYGRFGGTSQAAPHVAGLAALVLGAYPALSPEQLAVNLKANAEDRGERGPDNSWGHGLARLSDPPGADLDGLSISQSTLTPDFAPSITNYTAEVADAVATITVAGFAAGGVEIAPPDADPGTDGHQVNLSYGSNDVLVTVTGDRGARKVYRVRVRRGTVDVDLASLRLSQGKLTPAFSRGFTAYEARVGDEVTATRVTVVASPAAATTTLSIAPADADASSAGHQVALAAGVNTISVRVSAPAPSTVDKTYTIAVTRAATPANHAPTVAAGADQTVTEGATVTLRGGGTDPEGAALAYFWQQRAGAPVRLDNPSAQNPTFVAPNLLATSTLTFALTVSDGLQNSVTPDLVDVTVGADNDAPIAHAGFDLTAAYDAKVTLDGTRSSDPENQTLSSWSWTQTDGVPTVRLTGGTERQATFRTPRVDTTLTFALTVSDGANISAPAQVTIRVSGAVADHDDDDDGLIEIRTVAQLNAVRYDLDGDGVPTDSGVRQYAAAFETPATRMGCSTECRGYELDADLDLNAPPYNTGAGWVPIGGGDDPDVYEAAFNGNGHTISNLYINHPGPKLVGAVGLFHSLEYEAKVEAVTLVNANVTGGDILGGLAAVNFGTVVNCHVSGAVSSDTSLEFLFVGVGGLVGINYGVISESSASATVRGGSRRVGGLAGINHGDIRASYVRGAVLGNEAVGGLVGFHGVGGTIVASYSAATVTGNIVVGGLVGVQQGGAATDTPPEIIASYASGLVAGKSSVGGLAGVADGGKITLSYWDSEATGVFWDGHTGQRGPAGAARTTSVLQNPTDYTGIFADWNVDVDGDGAADQPWAFGADTQYPVLRHGALDAARQFQAQTASADTNAELAALTVSPGVANRAFDSAVHAYGVNVTGSHSQVTVAATPRLAGANVVITPADADAATAGHQVALAEHAVTVTVLVAAGGSRQEYSLKMVRNSRDTDFDGYIEVSTVAQLDAMRFDADGDGKPDVRVRGFDERVDHLDIYATAFSTTRRGTACVAVCLGYELIADLDLDVPPHNTGSGWLPIGGFGNDLGNASTDAGYSAAFLGNGHTIANLFINRPTKNTVGFFGNLLGTVEALGLRNVNVTGRHTVGGLAANVQGGGHIVASHASGFVAGDSSVGGLVGGGEGAVLGSYSRGVVRGASIVGGLAGTNSGEIKASYAAAEVFGNTLAGGLVGWSEGDIATSYALGPVAGRAAAGGLVGRPPGRYGLGTTVAASYWDIDTSGQTRSTQGEGKTTGELQSPTAYDGIYATWNQALYQDAQPSDPWDFGDATQYPVLRYRSLDAEEQFRAQAQTQVVAHLRTLAVSPATLRPAFDGTKTNYTTAVGRGTARVTVTAVAEDPAATVTITPADADATASGHQVNLGDDDAATTIVVVVTAADGHRSRTYLVTVLRGNPDADFDGLIEIATPAQLNAIRWDLNGDGRADDEANAKDYAAAFGFSGASALWCANGCLGFELAADIDLNVAPYNTGAGWVPIGDFDADTRVGRSSRNGASDTVLRGNGHVISNLYINAPHAQYAGLFAVLLDSSVVDGVTLANANVTGGSFTGGLVGLLAGAVTSSAVTGVVRGSQPGGSTGGLAGWVLTGTIVGSWSNASVRGAATSTVVGGLIGGGAQSAVRASYASGSVTGDARGIAGGLVGFNVAGEVSTSYAVGAVTGAFIAGGLVGLDQFGNVTDSYWDSMTSGQPTSAAGTPQTTSALKTPTAYADTIYAAWNVDLDGMPGNDDPWDFGTADQYPVLKYGRAERGIARQDATRDASLSALAFDPPLQLLAPGFNPWAVDYNGVFGAVGDSGTVTVTATPAQTGATVAITPADADDGDGHQVFVDAADGAVVTIGVTAPDGSRTRTYRVALALDVRPVFGVGVTVADQVWRTNASITPVELPRARGGNGRLAYAIRPGLPEGLEARDFAIVGTPLAAAAETAYEWTATDVDGDAATLRFMAVVEQNNAPVALAPPAPVLAVDGEVDIPMSALFVDPDGDELAFEAQASGDVAVSLAGDTLRITALAVGMAGVGVTATDPSGATATTTIAVTVVAMGDAVSFVADARAAEGETARLEVQLNAVRSEPVRVEYTVHYATEPGAASPADHDLRDGAVIVPSGATSTPLAIAIVDDDEIEPARERFTVRLRVPDGLRAGAKTTAAVIIEEGVCDRSPAVRDALRGRRGCTEVLDSDLAGIVSLRLENRGIQSLRAKDLAGLGLLESLTLGGNTLSNLPMEVFEATPRLRSLDLAGNALRSLWPLTPLKVLATLDMSDNDLQDLRPLNAVAALESLWLGGNRITDIGTLAALTSLRELALDRNRVSDLAPLAAIESLERLWLQRNAVEDISALVGNTGLGMAQGRLDGGDLLDLRGNPLNQDARSRHGPALRERGATVLFDDQAHVVAVFPSARPGRQGFVRVASRSAHAGLVTIRGFDESGRSTRLTTFPIRSHAATHFDSRDLQWGSAAKKLPVGIGAADGDWRLEFRAATEGLDFEVLAYARQRDGFATGLNVAAPETYARHRVGMFNPGRNTVQASRLRLVNPGAKEARAVVLGVDDLGRMAQVAVTVPAGGARDFGAAALEAGPGSSGVVAGALGAGAGKWRLVVRSYDGLRVFALLDTPAAHSINLSAGPVRAAADGVRHVPLFPSASSADRHGFVRVANRSARAGEARVTAFDAQGRARPPVLLSLGANRTAHFNSADLERGNPAKGLAAGVGAGDGGWRLEIASALNLDVYAYVRAADGFLAAVHGFAPADQDGIRRIAFFNPGSNETWTSRLRLVNLGDATAAAHISGVDDGGASGQSTVRVDIPANGWREFTAGQLERGDAAGLDGALGDGAGNWRLTVRSDGQVEAMSLLESVDSRLANLSALPE